MIKRKPIARTPNSPQPESEYPIRWYKFRARAEKLWPKAYWITSGGRWASVSECDHDGATVWLWETLQEAHDALDFIDRTACGSGCWRNHFIFDLALGKALPHNPMRDSIDRASRRSRDDD
jgi:hypothetical protein